MVSRVASSVASRFPRASGSRVGALILATSTLAWIAIPAARASATLRAATVSGNWAGYVVEGRAPTLRIGRVSGEWVQPSAVCTRGRRGYSAFWVGLGGFKSSSTKLEQAGTEADCDARGRASYSAWYEVVPAAAVPIGLAIRPGDRIAASVSLTRASVAFHLRDLTSGRIFARRLAVQSPDASSAEWIAEAPSSCSPSACAILPLTDFGTVAFAGASATATNGHTGRISDPKWSPRAIEIGDDPEASTASGGSVFAGASPGALASGGSSFLVTWKQTVGPAAKAPAPIGPGATAPGGGAPGGEPGRFREF